MINDDLYATLFALFNLSKATLPIDASAIGELINLSPTEVGMALVELERSGLVDASRARLTMAGLVVALSPKAKAGAARLINAKARAKTLALSLPMAAQSEGVALETRPVEQTADIDRM
jgi:DNA-binding MarR family transcriptional regulator